MTQKNPKDEKVLDFMFDPFLVEYSSGHSNFSIPNQNENKEQNEELTPEQLASKKYELEAIKMAIENEFDKSLELFQKALNLWPRNPSIFNNRAQTYRLLNRLEEAQLDLDRAIELSGNNDDCQNSQNDLNVARQAYCQRALIHLFHENKDQGLKDMAKAAELGNKFARSYMAKRNPYAALCNKMLHDMFEQFRKST